MLQNDDIECDWMFRLSFAHDIAKVDFFILLHSHLFYWKKYLYTKTAKKISSFKYYQANLQITVDTFTRETLERKLQIP